MKNYKYNKIELQKGRREPNMATQRFLRQKKARLNYTRNELVNSEYQKGPSVIKSDDTIRIVASIKVQFQEPIFI